MSAGRGKIREFRAQNSLGYERTQAQTTYLEHDQSANGINQSSIASHDFQYDQYLKQLKLGGTNRSEAPKNYKSEYAHDKTRGK